MPATEAAILRSELGWAAVSGGVVTIIMLAIIYAGVVHHINPPSNIETVDPKTLHLTGEFTEGNLGTSVDNSGGRPTITRRFVLLPIFAGSGISTAGDSRRTASH